MRKTVLVFQMGYRGEPQVQVSDSIMTEIANLMNVGDCGVGYFSLSGSCILPHLRNRAVAIFLASTFTDLVMIDDDNWVEAGGLAKLIASDEDVVAAPIRVKVAPPEVKWNFNMLQDEPLRRAPNGLIRVANAGTGFIKITRRAIEALIAADPDGWYHDDDAPGGKAHALFEYSDPRKTDHRWWGEDLTFSKKWTALGNPVWVHPDIKTFHMGKMIYEGRLADDLANRPPTITMHEGHTGEVLSHMDNEFAPPERLAASKAKISLCIASRGRPKLLYDTLSATMSNSVLPGTTAIVGLDHDDDTKDRAAEMVATISRVEPIFADREDSLGEKYNRCSRAKVADLYVLGVDKMSFKTKGWDLIVAEQAAHFKDGIGVVFFGHPHVASSNPASYAMTAKFREIAGYFMPPHFPFWWHDTWTTELAELTGRFRWAQVEMGFTDHAERSRGARDIAYWASVYDRMQDRRLATARRIIDRMGETPERKADLIAAFPVKCQLFLERNRPCSDPVNAAKLEAVYSFDAPEDERYIRIKRRAEILLTAAA